MSKREVEFGHIGLWEIVFDVFWEALARNGRQSERCRVWPVHHGAGCLRLLRSTFKSYLKLGLTWFNFVFSFQIEICEILNKNKEIKIYWHPEHDVPYAYKPGLWIGYDNIKSLINKVDYLKRMNLGGVIVWSLDMDDKTGQVCNEGPYPVLNTLKRELLKPNPYTKTSTRSARLITGFPRGFWSKRQPGSNAMGLQSQYTIFKLLFSTLLFVRFTSFVSFNFNCQFI